MTEIINFIIMNYTWILVIVILILLAIIGSIADKTNFGEGKKNDIKEETKETPNVDLSNKRMDDFFSNEKKEANNNQNINQPISNNVTYNENQTAVGNDVVNTQDNVNIVQNTSDNNGQVRKEIMKSLEDKLSSLDSEINSALPKKSIINDDMLEDIDDMSFESKDLFSSGVDRDFSMDDLELPEIKSLKKDDGDVWKL